MPLVSFKWFLRNLIWTCWEAKVTSGRYKLKLKSLHNFQYRHAISFRPDQYDCNPETRSTIFHCNHLQQLVRWLRSQFLKEWWDETVFFPPSASFITLTLRLPVSRNRSWHVWMPGPQPPVCLSTDWGTLAKAFFKITTRLTRSASPNK